MFYKMLCTPLQCLVTGKAKTKSQRELKRLRGWGTRYSSQIHLSLVHSMWFRMSLVTPGASISSTVNWAGASTLQGTTDRIIRKHIKNEVLVKPEALLSKRKTEYPGPEVGLEKSRCKSQQGRREKTAARESSSGGSRKTWHQTSENANHVKKDKGCCAAGMVKTISVHLLFINCFGSSNKYLTGALTMC